MSAQVSAGSAVRNHGSIPVFGDVLPFMRDKTGFLRKCHLLRGDQVRLNIGQTVWLINGADDIAHVLAGNPQNYEKSRKLTSRRGRELSGYGLHTATGTEHLPKRRMVQPLFARQAVDLHAAAINRNASEWFSRWHGGSVIDLFDEMMRLSQQIMIHALLGDGFEDHNHLFADAVTDRRAYIEYFFTSNLPFAEKFPFRVVRRYRRARQYLHQIIGSEISKRRATKPNGPDFLSMLLAARGRDGQPLTDSQVRDEAITITSTGYETIGAALTWTWHLLTLHPELRQAMYEEVRASSSSQNVDVETVGKLVLTRRIFDESLRLYPPTWLFVRQATATDTLPSGVTIRAGDKIYLCPYTMHRHPAWYPEPERFNPDNFLEQAVKSRPRYSFLPFGGGARQCIGEPFARLEAMILLARMARQFEFHHLERPVSMKPGIVLEPRGGLPMEIRLR